ncbi:hypothetical protein H0H81_002758 [Sphagnurus paluster]|uniref:Uncharacterized protein n=1 Tax=Sphagnurus paluster TaxID=117069 RepID=A0A9P7GT67_9AGAR|nr:hypothetical protein H0H81_002758 [Sphagnurus paluster]
MATHAQRAGSTPAGPSLLITLAVQTIHVTLQHYKVPFAFTGNVACEVYGEAIRPSEQVEVLLLNSGIPIPDFNQALAHSNPAFFTCLPNGRLFFHNASIALPNSIEVVFNLPGPTSSAVPTAHGAFPVVPYSVLLLQHLAIWESILPGSKMQLAHGASVLKMLSVFRRRTEWQHDATFDPQLHAASVERVGRFFAMHPSFRKEWQRMGLLPGRPGAGLAVPTSVARQDAHTVRPQQPRTSSEPLQTRIEAVLPAVGQPPTVKPPRPRPVQTQSAPPKPKPQPLQPQKQTQTQTPAQTQSQSGVTTEKKIPPTPKTPKLSRMQVRRLAARTTVDILATHGFSCALFGSMACKLYGNPRIPNDIDMLVLPPPSSEHTQESIKDLLHAAAPTQFLLKPARDPGATYRVLWFLPTPGTKPTPSKACKVDILLPGVMHLPVLPADAVIWRGGAGGGGGDGRGGRRRRRGGEEDAGDGDGDGDAGRLPVLPFTAMLVQKLQAWDDHLHAEEERYREKAPVDVKDLEWLLGVGVSRYDVQGGAGVGMEWVRWVEDEFVRLTRARVEAFCVAYPRWVEVWRDLGFVLPG